MAEHVYKLLELTGSSSVGIEDAEDLVADLGQALDRLT